MITNLQPTEDALYNKLLDFVEIIDKNGLRGITLIAHYDEGMRSHSIHSTHHMLQMIKYFTKEINRGITFDT